MTVKKTELPNNVREQLQQEKLHWRVLFCTVAITLMFGILVLMLWQLQVIHGADYQKRTNRQSLRPVRINPVRGRLFAADGSLLVDNEAHYDIVFYLGEMRVRGRNAVARTVDKVMESEQRLANYLGRGISLQRDNVKRHLIQRPILPMTVFRDLNKVEIAAFSEMLPAMEGVEIQPRIERHYPHPGLLSQTLGMTRWRQPGENDILEDLPRLYTVPELNGESGLEAVYDRELSGRASAKVVAVDSIGYAWEETSRGTPEPGYDLHLTVDVRAQQIAEEVLQGEAGALVVVNVNTGAVIAMASAPTYNLDGLTGTQLVQMMHDEKNRPMINRATRGEYTPGSIMKPLLALAGLEWEAETSAETYDCNGRYLIGNHPIRCARRYGHGPLSIQEALIVSCNPFFINLGLKVGIDQYEVMLRAAGIGEKTGIEIGESAGLCPCRAFARSHWKRNWLAVDTAYASLGQGAVSVTPLQAALFTAAIANGGTVYRPFLVQKITSHSGNVINTSVPTPRHRLPASAENIKLVQEAMSLTVTHENASADGLEKAGIPLAAKTGTAEVGSGENRHKNAWVIAYGPVEEPTYALACVIERGDSGGRTAVPIAAEFFRRWLTAGE